MKKWNGVDWKTQQNTKGILCLSKYAVILSFTPFHFLITLGDANVKYNS